MQKKILVALFFIILVFTQNIYAINYRINVGDIINFGKYYIDTDEKQNIEWIVLDIQDNRALLFSRYILDTMSFSTIDKLTYTNSLLRTFLNGEFLENFSSDERQSIVLTLNEGYENVKYNVKDDAQTEDYVFLLNHNEIVKYFYDDNMNIINSAVYGVGTKYAKSKGLQCVSIKNFHETFSSYWLRSVGYNNCYAQVVAYNGNVLADGYFYHRFNCGLRPAMWISLGT